MTFEQELKMIGYAIKMAENFYYIPEMECLENVYKSICRDEDDREWCRLAIEMYSGYSYSDMVSTLKYKVLSIVTPPPTK